MDTISLTVLGILFGSLLVIATWLLCFYGTRKDIQKRDEPNRGIRIVMDSADSNAFYSLIEAIKGNKPAILGAQYNDAMPDTITVNLIVKEDNFNHIFEKIREIENIEAVETEIEITEESK